MSGNVTNFGRNGVQDWLIQRASAVVLAVYFLLIMGFFLFQNTVDYSSWRAFMACTPMKVATILVLLSFVAHGWIGMWTVSTDYLVKDGHLFGSVPTFVRLAFQGFCIIVLLACALWGSMLIWGL